jgi:hypothetical protein
MTVYAIIRVNSTLSNSKKRLFIILFLRKIVNRERFAEPLYYQTDHLHTSSSNIPLVTKWFMEQFSFKVEDFLKRLLK